MKIGKNLKIISIEKGVPVSELPNEVEIFILNSLVQTHYWNASGSAFQSPQDFIIWIDDEIHEISYNQYVNKVPLSPELISTLNEEKNWLKYKFVLNIKGVVQENNKGKKDV